MITGFLAELGYRVLSAADAQEAMEISAGHPGALAAYRDVGLLAERAVT